MSPPERLMNFQERRALSRSSSVPVNQPDGMVAFVHEKIDQDGKVSDQKKRKKIGELIESLVAWTKRLKGA